MDINNCFYTFSEEDLDLSDIALNQTAKKQLEDIIQQSKASNVPIGRILFVCSSKDRFKRIATAFAAAAWKEGIATDQLTIISKKLSNIFCINKRSHYEGMVAILARCSDKGCCIFLDKFQSIPKKILESLSSNNVTIITGKGQTAMAYTVTFPSYTALCYVNDTEEITDDIADLFSHIIILDSFEKEERIDYIKVYLNKYSLIASEETIQEIADMEMNENDLHNLLMKYRVSSIAHNTNEICMHTVNQNFDYSIDFVDKMNGREFEVFTGNLLRECGFKHVHITSYSGDFGADVIAEKDDIKYAIQCKRYSGAIGVNAVKEVIASKSIHQCHVACVLSNGYYTSAAKELAIKNLVLLWDRDKLVSMINQVKIVDF